MIQRELALPVVIILSDVVLIYGPDWILHVREWVVISSRPAA